MKHRLGSKSGVKELKRTTWFKGFRWDDLEQRRIEPPFRPRVSHGTDTRNFDRAFTNLPLHDARWVHIEDTELLRRSIKAGKAHDVTFVM